MRVEKDELSRPIEARNIYESPEREGFSPLGLCEMQVLIQVARGLTTNKEIAKELKISKQTVKNHLNSMFRKLNVGNKTEALLVFHGTIFAVKLGNPNFTLDEFQKTLLETAQGRADWTSVLTSSNGWGSLKDSGVSPLFPRETETLMYLSLGLLDKEIAREMGITQPTVRNHVNMILRKLQAKNRVGAACIFQWALFIAYLQNPDFTPEDFQGIFLKTIQVKDGGVRETTLSCLERLTEERLRIREERARRKREQEEKRIKKFRKIRKAIVLLLARGMSFEKIAFNLECPKIIIAGHVRWLYEEFGIDGRDPRRRELLVESAKEAWGLDLPSTSPSHERLRGHHPSLRSG